MGDRILGALCVLLAAAMGWAAQAYSAEISYEPVGPRAFPLLLAALMGLAGGWLLLRPTHPSELATGAPKLQATQAFDAVAVAKVAVAVVGYGLIFQMLGFVLATLAMGLVVGHAFGGSWRASALGGLGLGLGLYVLFDKVFDVVLPTGVLAYVLGGR